MYGAIKRPSPINSWPAAVAAGLNAPGHVHVPAGLSTQSAPLNDVRMIGTGCGSAAAGSPITIEPLMLITKDPLSGTIIRNCSYAPLERR
jgi:hypothetical protein